MECADLAERLTDLLEGMLDADDEAAAIEHLATCDRCELVLVQTRAVMAAAAEYGRAVLDPDERTSLMARIRGEVGSLRRSGPDPGDPTA